MIQIDDALTPSALLPAIQRMWALSADKIDRIAASFDVSRGAPVFTINGRYTARGWTEWTQGFQFGGAILQFDATGEERFLEMGRRQTVDHMASHVTHIGVHDHGFNNVSTYGNLLRLMSESRLPADAWERRFYELALKCSGAVQAARWTTLPDTGGYIYSFNGPHSLFSDTVRSLRALVLADRLGHALMGENDGKISLLGRAIGHLRSTSRYNVYFGEGRDHYDIPGRVVHESIFNLNDHRYRCASTQQGYTPFSTWTRGLAWIVCGYAEQLEYFATLPDDALAPYGGRAEVEALMLRTARATADFYLEHTPTCGVPYWDTGAPGLERLGDYLSRPADPFNHQEPVDSSAAAITAQGLLRLGAYLNGKDAGAGDRYLQAGLTVLKTLMQAPYLSEDARHEGLLLHAVYHRPNGWDHAPDADGVPRGESCMWGDYHLRELALYVQRLAEKKPYLTFFRISA
ncbi:MAG: hypothetical protein R2834_13825 [Rhodothermales bacterium]